MPSNVGGGGSLLELPLQPLALDRDVPEGLSEEVLRAVSAAVAAVAADGQHQLLVLAVVGKEALEPVTHLHEVLVLCDARLQEPRLDIDLLKGNRRKASLGREEPSISEGLLGSPIE